MRHFSLVTAIAAASAVFFGAASAAQASTPLLLEKSNDAALLQAQALKDGVTLPAVTWTGCGGLSDPLKCQTGQVPIQTAEGAVWAMAQRGYAGPVVFDIEIWSATPAVERADPLTYICRAAKLVKTDPKLQVIITPYSGTPGAFPQPGVMSPAVALLEATMIQEDAMAAQCGAYAIDIQSQFINANPPGFAAFIRAAMKAIRQQSKTSIILAGLATNNPVPQSVSNLVADWQAALAAGAQGFWFNAAQWVPTRCSAAQGGIGCPETGVQVLNTADPQITTSSISGVPVNVRHHRLTPRAYARSIFPRHHWHRWEFKYLNLLWNRESGWYKYATNPYSGAYGIPQSLPGDKMASAGANWATSFRTQIRWGESYIKDRYRTPYWAWQHELGWGWY